MSLLVWLPLHGNLTNYGSSPAKFTLVNSSSALSVGTTGKTDNSCYQRTKINTADYITSNINFNMNGDFTMACWCKVTEVANTTTANGIITNHGHTTGGAGITLKVTNATTCYMSCNTGTNGTDRTYHTHYGTTNIFGAWHHLCLTYDRSATKYRLYVDGVCEKEFTYGDTAGDRPFRIFDWSVDHSGNASYRPSCQLNDVRLYDHCLSKKEVKLLSQGLVAHYKLSVGNSNNLLKGTINFAGTGGNGSLSEGPFGSISKGYDYTSGTSSYKEISSWSGVISPKPNETYTASFYARSATSKQMIVYLYNNNTGIQVSNIKSSQGHNKTGTDGNCTLTLTPEWERYWITWTFNDNTTTLAKTLLFRVTAGNQAEIALVKLEQGAKDTGYGLHIEESGMSVADDSSGYSRHGTQAGNFIFANDAPRHGVCPIFDGTTTRINLPIKELMKSVLNDTCTVNFWVNEANTSDRSIYFGGFSGSNFNVEQTGKSFRVYWNGTPDLTVSNAITANEWAMFTVVINTASGIKIYKNGALIKDHAGALTNIVSGFTRDFNIGCDSRTDGTMMEGKISDFRIYCTALTESAILELYHTAASVTKEGGLIAYDFQEDKKNAKAKKNGVFIAEDFSERGKLADMHVKVLPDKSSWARVFYHNNKGGTVLFSSVSEALNSDTENKYSCLYLLDQLKATDGKYEFMLTYPSHSATGYNRWKQTNNPCNEFIANGDGSATAAGYSAVHIDFNTNYWGGLTRQNSSTTSISNCYLSGSTGHSNWYHAIGVSSAWNGGMPGPNTAVEEIELWVRIDTLPLNTKFNILKEQYVSSSLFQEI